MDFETTEKLKKIWNQKKTPVILRRAGNGERLRARLPYSKNNRSWIKNNRRFEPIWQENLKCWELPKKWFNDFVNRALKDFGEVYVIQPYREQEKCSPKCLEAQGHECQCSCMGANHGVGNDGSWFEVSDTFATRWGERELACRLISKK